MASAPGHRATPSFVLTSQIVLLRVTLHRTYVRHLALPCKTAVPIGRIRAAVVVKVPASHHNENLRYSPQYCYRIDIIGGSVYWLYANLCDLTRQTARVPGCDRPDARRVCAGAAGLCCGLCRTLSARQDLGRQGAPTPGRRRRPRRLVADGRQAALYSGLSEDESAANDARLASRAEPTPDPLLDASPAPGLAARLS